MRRRPVLSSVVWLAGALVILVAVAVVSQRRLIYLPDRQLPPPPPDVEMVAFTTDDGVEHRGWWVAADGDASATVVVCNGNAGNKADRVPLARALAERGLNVLLFDYRGYGDTPGSPDEAGLVADARAARGAAERRGGAPVVLLGESLGSGPATAVSAEEAPLALVLRSPFPSLAAVARVHYPFLPARWLLWDRYPVAAQVAEVESPVVVVLGTDDRIVPPQLSREVHAAAGPEARLVEVSGVGHNDPGLAWGPELIDATLAAIAEARIDPGSNG